MDEEQKSKLLADGPVGLWRTSAGTADALGTDDVRFDADGTGLITTRSMMSGIEEIFFLWSVSGPGRIRVRYAVQESGADLEQEADEWGEIKLEFEQQENDLGAVEVMKEVGQEGFWFLLDPLRWIGHPAGV